MGAEESLALCGICILSCSLCLVLMDSSDSSSSIVSRNKVDIGHLHGQRGVRNPACTGRDSLEQQPLRAAVNEEGSSVRARVDPAVTACFVALLIICLCSLAAGSSYVSVWGLLNVALRALVQHVCLTFVLTSLTASL